MRVFIETLESTKEDWCGYAVRAIHHGHDGHYTFDVRNREAAMQLAECLKSVSQISHWTQPERNQE